MLYKNNIESHKIVKTEYKTIGFIISVFGKSLEMVIKSLDSVNKVLDKANAIVIYRNNKEYSYDSLVEKYPMISFIKIEDLSVHIKKAQKLAIGSSLINTKFFIGLDCDDWIDVSKIDTLVNELNSINENSIISNSLQVYKYKKDSLKIVNPKVLRSANPSTIFPTKAFNEIFSDISNLPKTWLQHDRNLFYKTFDKVKNIVEINVPIYVWTINSSNESKNKIKKHDLYNATNSLLEVKKIMNSLIKLNDKQLTKLIKSEKKSMYWRWFFFFYFGKVNFFTLLGQQWKLMTK